MREITNIMIHEFNLNKLKYDFAGYTFDRTRQLSFHHLRISKHDCKVLNIPSEGYLYWNGAILRQDTSHDYLHIVQKYDDEIFRLITSEMIKENEQGRIDIENLRRIRDLLLYFEKEHCSDKTKKGKHLIKESYIKDRIKV